MLYIAGKLLILAGKFMKFNEQIFRHIDFAVLIVGSVLFIPFFGSNLSVDPVLMPRFVAWAIITSVLMLSFIIQIPGKADKPDYSFLRRTIFPVLFGYFLFSAISLTRAVNITEGVHEILKISVSAAYLFIAIVILNKNKVYIDIIAKTVLITAAVLSVITLYQYFTAAYKKPGVQIDLLYMVTATMAHKNQLSSALFLTFPFCLYCILISRNYWRLVAIISGILVLLNIVILQTRSVWLSFMLATAATMILVIIFSRKLNISKKVLLKCFVYTLIISITVLLIIGGIFHLEDKPAGLIFQRIKSITSFSHASNIERALMWKKTLQAADGNLMTGHGAGNWKIKIPSYGLDNLSQRSFKYVYFQRPHNDYIWVLFETGIFGFLSYISVFGIILFYILKIIIHSPDTNRKILAISIFFGIVGYMVFAFFSFPKERVFHSVFLMLMFAIVVSVYHQSVCKNKNISRPYLFVITAVCLCFTLSAIANGSIRLNSEMHTRKAFAARMTGNWPTVSAEIDKAYSRFATLDSTSTPLMWYKGEADFMLNNIPEALKDYQKAYKANPYHIHVLNNLATCYELQADHTEAIRYYRKALEIYPQFEETLINLGAAYFNCNRYEEAYETLSLCNPDTKDPRLKKYLELTEKFLDKNHTK